MESESGGRLWDWGSGIGRRLITASYVEELCAKATVCSVGIDRGKRQIRR